MAVADMNGDGLDDVFIGGARDQPSAILIQQQNGGFVRSNEKLLAQDSISEDVAATFFDAAVSLVPREFITIFVAVVVAMVIAVGKRPVAKPAIAIVTALYVVSGMVVLVSPARDYAEHHWATSRIMADVRAMPKNSVIYTNAPDAIYLLAHRAVSSIPETRDFSCEGRAYRPFRPHWQTKSEIACTLFSWTFDRSTHVAHRHSATVPRPVIPREPRGRCRSSGPAPPGPSSPRSTRRHRPTRQTR